MEAIFTKEDSWNGGYYELSLELPGYKKSIISKALASLWSVPALHGCYLRNDVESQPRIHLANLPHEGHIYGMATFPNGKQTACGTYICDFDADGIWMTLYVPLGSLSDIYPCEGYPFGGQESPEPWLRIVHIWFKEIAEMVYTDIAFSIGIIGFELDFVKSKKQALIKMPRARWEGFLIPNNGTLKWYPPTIYEYPCNLGYG